MKTTCTIIIFNCNSTPFLRLCVKQIMKNQHPEIEIKILVAEQSDPETQKEVIEKFSGYLDVTIVPMKKLRSGYAVDFIMRNVEITTEFICTLDVDTFVLHPNWLLLPITLIKEDNFKFVGGLFFESRAEETAHCFLNNPFYCLAQYYRIGRAEDYRKLSMEGGFTILHARPETGFKFGNNAWLEWAESDYINRGSDDSTIAHFWEDNFETHNKLSLAVTHFIGASDESGYGRILDDMVMHYGFIFWGLGLEDKIGRQYAYWKERINNGDETVIDDMVAVARNNPASPAHISGTQVRSVWDGQLKKSIASSEELNKKIERLKNI